MKASFLHNVPGYDRKQTIVQTAIEIQTCIEGINDLFVGGRGEVCRGGSSRSGSSGG